MKKKSAFIAIVGVPNVGKSSILNALIGQKVSIVSPKPQTTRTRIMGVLTENDTQLVFIDTPGAHKARTRLGQYMEKSVRSSMTSVDVCLLVVVAGKSLKSAEINLIESLKNANVPVILAINKIDTLRDKSSLMNQIAEISSMINCIAVVPVSAKTGGGLDDLLDELKKVAVCDGHLFPEDALTDQPESVLVAEFIREKILKAVEEEVPHGVAVRVERMSERKNGALMDIDATIYCEKSRHKGILIGKHGDMLKQIGSRARADIESFLGIGVNLQIWVKVKEDWRNRPEILRNFGFDEKALDM